MESKARLPILLFEEKIAETVDNNPVAVIIGETGSGKSTQLSQILHRKGYTRSGCIAVTQRRRVAAVSVSRLRMDRVEFRTSSPSDREDKGGIGSGSRRERGWTR
ncbi:putative pre-mRNA-splicing factor ATP-dependent RNA helicase DEAH4 [Primulina tabacum]|uniref:putative pre-mRNA-splicing factor ATP-dependent RNA helicase DEAH4 n=1 Tax=Primulina tabacum TaxID=48773 RepID=UPI003F594BE2